MSLNALSRTPGCLLTSTKVLLNSYWNDLSFLAVNKTDWPDRVPNVRQPNWYPCDMYFVVQYTIARFNLRDLSIPGRVSAFLSDKQISAQQLIVPNSRGRASGPR